MARSWIDLQLAPQPQDLDIDAPDRKCPREYGWPRSRVLPREGPLRRLKKSNRAYSPLPRKAPPASPGSTSLRPRRCSTQPLNLVPAPLGIAGPRSPSHFLSPQNERERARAIPLETAKGFDKVVIVGTELEADNTVDFCRCEMTGRDNHRNIRMRSGSSLLRRSSPSSWLSRKSGILIKSWRRSLRNSDSIRFCSTSNVAGTLRSSRYLATICRSAGSSSTTITIWPGTDAHQMNSTMY